MRQSTMLVLAALGVALLASHTASATASLRTGKYSMAKRNFRATERHTLFWIVPYGNYTSVAEYEKVWHQFQDNYRPGYILAASAYAAKQDGTLGLADTVYGEAEHGDLMDAYGIPALKNLGQTVLGMVYVTHYAALDIIFADPQPFIKQLLDKADELDLDGFDIDFEPQPRHRFKTEAAFEEVRQSVMDMYRAMGEAFEARGLILTTDVFCGGTFDCREGATIPGIDLINTMNSFGLTSLDQWAAHLPSLAYIGDRWAPGFLPGNQGEGQHRQITEWLALPAQDQRAISTWLVYEFNEHGDQPQWLFDNINAYLDAPHRS